MASLIPKVFSEKHMGTTLGRNRISALSDIDNLLTNATCEAKVSCHHTLHLAHEINQCGHPLAIIFILKGSPRLHNMACLGWLSLSL